MKTKNLCFLIGDELLVAVFNQFQKGICLWFTLDDLMLAFYKASKKSAYAEFFENYKFDEDGQLPYSNEIGDGIFDLRICEIIYPLAASNRWQFSNAVEIRFNKVINPRLNEKQRELLKKLSSEIKKTLFPLEKGLN